VASQSKAAHFSAHFKRKRILTTNVRTEPAKKGVDYGTEYRGLWKDWLDLWKEAIRFPNGAMELLAGVTVAAVALPLNLALAVACGLPPSAGLLAGAIGGAVAAIFGGSALQVTGPAAALSPMVLLLANDFGANGIAAACLMIGVMQLALCLGLAGRIARYVPEAVLAGFTTGVGLKLLDNQIPELLGFDYTVLEMGQMMHRPAWLHEVSWLAVVCGMFVALFVSTTKQWKRFPAALIAVSVVTALSVYLKWDINRVGNIPSIIPVPTFPNLADDKWLDLFLRTVPLGLLAAVESLLSARVVDHMINAKKGHNANLELFGQGLANFATGLFGGMPVTGVVVRSGVNVQSGAKTKISALTHALVLLFSVLFLSGSLAQIPLAGLAGLLSVVGFRLLEVKTLMELLRTHKVEAIAFLVTAAGTVSGFLVQGLILGLLIVGLDHLLNKKTVKAKEAERVEKEGLRKQGIRAVLERETASARRPGHYESTPGGQNWLAQIRERAQVATSAFVHGQASVIGRVVLGENVHIAAGTSVRADEGTPFFIGKNSNLQDGVVIHALKEKWVNVGGEDWAVYVGQDVSMAHQALVHGPCYIGDHSFIGFKAVVHDSIIGSNCYVGIGAVVVGVEVPDGRFVPHGAIIDTAEKAESLPKVTAAHTHFNEDVVEVNRGLAAAYRRAGQSNANSTFSNDGRMIQSSPLLTRFAEKF